MGPTKRRTFLGTNLTFSVLRRTKHVEGPPSTLSLNVNCVLPPYSGDSIDFVTVPRRSPTDLDPTLSRGRSGVRVEIRETFIKE